MQGDGELQARLAAAAEVRAYCENEGMTYLRDDGEQHRAPFGELPVVCNYFYHEEVRKSARRGAETSRA